MNKVVVGAQWGDEGKAKITDLLAQNADLVIRYQGGCNAGHTVVAHNKTFKFHLIPSGILYKGKTCFIGAGTVILPESFEAEIKGLIERLKKRARVCGRTCRECAIPFRDRWNHGSDEPGRRQEDGHSRRGREREAGALHGENIPGAGCESDDLLSHQPEAEGLPDEPEPET